MRRSESFSMPTRFVFRWAVAILLLSAVSRVLAAAPLSEPPPARISTMLVFGEDPCPRSSDDEIVVCARQPESERYRIPKPFRGKKAKAAEQSWIETARSLDFVSRIGTPDSCSPVGSGGQTGCFRRFQELARTERNQPNDQR